MAGPRGKSASEIKATAPNLKDALSTPLAGISEDISILKMRIIFLLSGVLVILIIVLTTFSLKIRNTPIKTFLPVISWRQLPFFLNSEMPALVADWKYLLRVPRNWNKWGAVRSDLLLSPDGVFGVTGYQAYQAKWDSAENNFVGDGKCRPRHIVEPNLKTENAMDIFRTRRMDKYPWATYFYVRSWCPVATKKKIEMTTGFLSLMNVAPYLSHTGCVTNLHYDLNCGILEGDLGYKQCILLEPSVIPSQFDGIDGCTRRALSPFDGKWAGDLENAFGVKKNRGRAYTRECFVHS